MKPRIVIAIPTGRPLTGKVPKKVLKIAQGLSVLAAEFEVVVSMSAEPRISHAVNMLIDKFREERENEWFLWFDLKTEIDAVQIMQLFSAQKAVIGALVTTCAKEAQWDAGIVDDVEADENGVLRVAELSPGAKLFHRSVFDLIERNAPDEHYVYDNSGKSVYAFCQEKSVEWSGYQRLLSASQHLDMLLRNAKIGVFAHTGVLPFRRDLDGVRHPAKVPYKSWLFKRQPPPVLAEELPEAEATNLNIMVIIQYCAKDSVEAERLCKYIQSSNPGQIVVMAFSKGDKYPSGPNKTAIGLLCAEYGRCKAVLLLEPDCCPMTPDWLDQLSRDWDRCSAAGKLIMGSWHPVNTDHPTLGHINGCLMFDPALSSKIAIPDVPDDKPWDTYLADVFAPVWARTGLIKNLNRHKTATVEQLTKPECGTKRPVLIHGVRDNSAWDYAASK